MLDIDGHADPDEDHACPGHKPNGEGGQPKNPEGK